MAITPVWRDPALPVPVRVRALMSEMTLPEKVAQLGSSWPHDTPGTDGVVSQVAPLEAAMTSGVPYETDAAVGLGHITRVYGTAPVTPAAGGERLRRFQEFLTRETRLGIPAIAHEECLTGVTTLGATVYPAPIAWGAAFDPGLVERLGAAIGRDLRALGVHQGLAPLLDVVRDYRWGRVEETCGEDPYLVGALGAAYVRGLQSQGIIATLKHFAGYSASRAGRNHAPVSMGPREFADVILPSFETAVREGGARSVMNSYSDIDGQPAATNGWLLTECLRENWGFRGTVVSDYGSVAFVHSMHKVAADLGDAARLTLTAGLDVELPAAVAYPRLTALVERGEVPVALVDRALERVLTQKAELGLLDAGWAPAPTPVDLDSAANRALAAELAEQSVILLANPRGLLPVRPDARLTVIGPVADDPHCLFGCYSYPNHVLLRQGDATLGVDAESLLGAARRVFGDVAYVPGCEVATDDGTGIPAAVAAAAGAGIVLLTVGDRAGLFGHGTCGEGCDAQTLALPGVQGALVEAVLATGTPVILLVVSGRPYALGAYAGRAAAIVQAFMPGEEGAGAVMRVLTGAVNPSGKLPVGIPSAIGGQPTTYLAPPLGLASQGISNVNPGPLYPFGYGLSYTSFELGDFAVDRDDLPVDGEVGVSVTVRNTGARAGAEVVQLYLGDEVAQVTRPVKQLLGFAKVRLDPGQSARVRFRVHADRTAFTGRDPATRLVEPGWIALSVGTSSEDVLLGRRIEIVGEVRDVTRGRVLTTPVTVDWLAEVDV
ncbi:MAG: glycoside hydrolase family 3 C-terminal domain-containing protein [Propionibacteriaceae bacterium]|jgi:beta-glucosidase|nr:glycoside hydrolase family 3 C-terminal domain-containing protein [Propionibacteriaceae bacterium]